MRHCFRMLCVRKTRIIKLILLLKLALDMKRKINHNPHSFNQKMSLLANIIQFRINSGLSYFSFRQHQQKYLIS